MCDALSIVAIYVMLEKEAEMEANSYHVVVVCNALSMVATNISERE